MMRTTLPLPSFFLAAVALSVGLLPSANAQSVGLVNPPPVYIEVNPSIDFDKNNSNKKVLAIKFDDPFSKTVGVKQPISVQVEAILSAGITVPLSPKKISLFVETRDPDTPAMYTQSYRQEGSLVSFNEPGRYLLKAVYEDENVQGGLAYATKQVTVR